MRTSSPEALFQRRLRTPDRFKFLRPLNPGDVLEVSVRSYQLLGRFLVGRIALPVLGSYASLIFIFSFLVPRLFITQDPGSMVVQALEVIVVGLITALVALPLFAAGMGYAFALVARAASALLHGAPLDKDGLAEEARGRALAVTGTLLLNFWVVSIPPLLSGVAALVAAFVLQVPALENSGLVELISGSGFIVLFASIFLCPYLAFRRCLAPVVAAVEGVRPAEAIRRSLTLTRRYPYHGDPAGSILMTGMVLFFAVLSLAVGVLAGIGLVGLGAALDQAAVQSPLGQIAQLAATLSPAYLGLWLVCPIWMLAMTTIYYDRRVRLEAYDVETIARDVVPALRRAAR